MTSGRTTRGNAMNDQRLARPYNVGKVNAAMTSAIAARSHDCRFGAASKMAAFCSTVRSRRARFMMVTPTAAHRRKRMGANVIALSVARMRSNEKEISHGRVSLQIHWTCFAKGPLA